MTWVAPIIMGIVVVVLWGTAFQSWQHNRELRKIYYSQCLSYTALVPNDSERLRVCKEKWRQP